MSDEIEIIVTPQVPDADLSGDATIRELGDHLAILAEIEKSETGEQVIDWRISSVSMNSPLCVRLIPAHRDPQKSLTPQSRQIPRIYVRGLSRFYRGEHTPTWLNSKASNLLENIAKRHQEHIGTTQILTGGEIEDAISITPTVANSISIEIRKKKITDDEAATDMSHTALGSIEGVAHTITLHRGQPILKVVERVSGNEVSCKLPSHIHTQIGRQHLWDEVWERKRLLISGKLKYNKQGIIDWVEVYEIEVIEPKDIHIKALRDPSFTGGLSIVEHLNQIRGDENE